MHHLWILLFVFCVEISYAKNNVHYFIAEEVHWNYLADGPLAEQYTNEEDNLSAIPSEPNIGNVYKKAVFREYTDETYSERVLRPGWLGILGPILQAEVGDNLEIHLLNNVSFPVSLHTHGAFYEKHHEGALYTDNTKDKNDDSVLPQHNYTYVWSVPEGRGPTSSDADCLLWAYHSHVFGDTDIHTGLIGPLIVCKKGHPEEDRFSPNAISQNFILLFLIFDENQSWYLEENIDFIRRNYTEEEKELLKENESFQISNHKHSVNGLMHSKAENMIACTNSIVTWYMMGMGNEADIHAVTFEGQSVTMNGHRTDVIHLLPGKFLTARMKPFYEGRWAITSGNNFHAGMTSSFITRNCSNSNEPNEQDYKKIVRYYIAAEEIMWDYAPSGMNLLNGVPLLNDTDTAMYFEQRFDRIGGTYKKVVYREYADDSFEKPKPQPLSMGILGPTIRVEIGDLLEVTFLNRATRPYSFHSTAFICLECGQNKSTAVNPGGNRTFQFSIHKELGPSETDSDCIAWRYFSNIDSLKDTYSGLNGFLLTCRPESLNANGLQNGVSKEYALTFGVMDENKSHYLEENIRLVLERNENFSEMEFDINDPDFIESNLMHSMNGLMYGNLQGMDLCIGDNVTWLLSAIGQEVDLHVAQFSGNAFMHDGQFRDTVQLLSGSHIMVSMIPDNAGIWDVQSRTNDYIKAGMQMKYMVEACNGPNGNATTPASGKVINYYLAIVEEEWDYAPSSLHPVTNETLSGNSDSKTFVVNDDVHIGSRYVKALFKEFTDETFQTEKVRRTEEEHLGFLGPSIKAEVGDVIQIILWNNGSREFNIRPHGLLESSRDANKSVEPKHNETFVWQVPRRSGPSSEGFNCTNWIYYSAVDSVKDTNSGLIGPLIICNPGTLDESGSRKDVEWEYSVLFSVMDENESWYLNRNIKQYCHDPQKVDTDNEDFKESNLMHAMNGRMYGSLKGLTGNVGDKVAWYLMALGNNVDIHTAHFHGLTGIEKDDGHLTDGRREDVVDLGPGIFRTLEMVLDVEGTWMFHCHVDDHLKGGMLAFVTVNP